MAPRKKHVKFWVFVVAIVFESIFEGFVVMPYIFQTTVPIGIGFLPFLLVFVAWKVIEGSVGYYITRG